MNFADLLLLGMGLSMDAFAVAVCKGLSMKKINYRHSFVIAFFFGGFQALMPFIGYYLGKTFEKYITRIDHWIAFILLAYIGGKMVYDALSGEEEEETVCAEALDVKELFMLAVATSIDALAIGITFSFFKDTNIINNITVIGITTFIISFGGIFIGNKFGTRYKTRAEIAGGIILVLLGVKILLEGLGVITF